jgi:hypothetical protein
MQLAVEFMYSGQVLVPSDKLNDFMDLAKGLEIRGLGAFEKAVEATNSKPPPSKRKAGREARGKNKKEKGSDEEDEDEANDEEWKLAGEGDDEDGQAPKSKRARGTPAAKKAPPPKPAASAANKKSPAAKKNVSLNNIFFCREIYCHLLLALLAILLLLSDQAKVWGV